MIVALVVTATTFPKDDDDDCRNYNEDDPAALSL